MPVLLLLLAACGQREHNEVSAEGRNSALSLRVRIEAAYDATLGHNVSLTLRNEESFPVCFSSDDLLPGSGTTFVRDSAGRLLNGQINQALEGFRGVNVAGPVTVLRPGQSHHELLDLEQDRPDQGTPVILQIGFSAFRCRDLFAGGNIDISKTLIERTFDIAVSGTAEYHGVPFENGQESPPSLR
jgi:hypothetical protein